MVKAKTSCRRLDDTLEPLHYNISLVASPNRPNFKGTVSLDAKVTRPTRKLVLHARGLTLESATVKVGRRQAVLSVSYEAADEWVVLQLQPNESPLPAKTIKLNLAFRGTLASSMHGLYLAKDGPEVALVTQCEASDARAILPCLDEPAFKATFAWEITTERGLDVIANGRATHVAEYARHAVHTFAKTTRMSTYLLAVTIGQFEGGRAERVGPTACRIYAGRGKAHQTEFASEVTRRVLPWYVDYFGAPYAFDKLDQVAVPGFDAGAMENSGAIFYRQSLLLLTRGRSSQATLKRSAEVIAHEIAHQWFGNLVTMRWWDDLWLNEAFATWIAFKVCNELYPDWELWLDYLEAKEAALAADALPTTHPIYAPVASPAEATELFDVITYEKGCGVLRMAERFLGEAAFRSGIRRYIKKYRLQNAEGQDLWRELSAACGEDVAGLMGAWIRTPGFPVVACELKASAGHNILSARQQRFFEHGGQPAKALWPVPLVIVYSDGTRVERVHHLLKTESEDIRLPSTGTVKWAYANDDASGFFRLQMGESLRKKVFAHATSHVSTATRLAMLTDEWALVRAGQSAIGHALDAFVALQADAHPNIVRAIASRLRSIGNHLVAAEDEPAFLRFVEEYAAGHLARLKGNIEDDRPVAEGLVYATSFELMGLLARNPDTLAIARRWQKQEAKNPEVLDANLAGSVVALSAVAAEPAHFRKLLAIYMARKQAGATPELQGRYLSALCLAEDDESLTLLVSACQRGDIPQEQLRSVLATLLSRKRSQQFAWRWLTANWAEVAPKIGAMGIARLIEATGALPYRYKEPVQAFFGEHPVPEAVRAIAKAVETMELWQGIRQREQARLSAWLARRTK